MWWFHTWFWWFFVLLYAVKMKLVGFFGYWRLVVFRILILIQIQYLDTVFQLLADSWKKFSIFGADLNSLGRKLCPFLTESNHILKLSSTMSLKVVHNIIYYYIMVFSFYSLMLLCYFNHYGSSCTFNCVYRLGWFWLSDPSLSSSLSSLSSSLSLSSSSLSTSSLS